MVETSTAPNQARPEETPRERTRGGQYLVPRVDIYETESELLLIADVPGVGTEDVDLRFERAELILHGRARQTERGQQKLFQEFEKGDFYRVFQISETIDSSRIDATCKNGVLTVHLPKIQEAQPRQVKVRGD